MSPETTNVQLGDGLTVSPLGFGGMALTPVYGEVDPAESLKTLHHAVDAGISFIDTADIYGAGDNEELIAKLLKDRRDEVQLATKFGIVGNPRDGYTDVRGDTAYVGQAAEASLRRLGTDVIDLYYMHRRDPAVPLAESVGAMAELVQQGKVKQLGLSEVTGAELREAYAVHPIAALQSEWSLFSRDVERSAVPAAVELGVTFVPYSPLGRGFLTGAFTDAAKDLSEGDFRKYQPRFTGDNAKKNAALLEPVHKIAAAHGASAAQVALAWVQQRAQVHGLTVVPIPGTRRSSRLLENVAATRLTLTAEELAQLEPIAGQVAGDRYPDMSSTSAARE